MYARVIVMVRVFLHDWQRRARVLVALILVLVAIMRGMSYYSCTTYREWRGGVLCVDTLVV